MNKLLIIVFSISCFECVSQDRQQFDQLKGGFATILIPFNSSSLNDNANLIAISKKTPLSEKDVLRFVLAGDQQGLQYVFEKYDMETGQSKGTETVKYKFYPAFKIEQKEMWILIVLRTSVDSQSYFLSVYDQKNETSSEAIEINKLDGEEEYKVFKSSYLDNDLKLRVFKYEINREYLKNLKSEPFKSILTETVYQINGSLKLISTNTTKSRCSVSDFYERNKKCADQDPMRNLRVD
ncbi:MAG TPA: hypothetical protein VGD65_13775 [Chryseosolibacter sp.]